MSDSLDKVVAEMLLYAEACPPIVAKWIAELESLARQHREEVAELERLRVQLAGCGVAAMSNTRESLARAKEVTQGVYGYSASYGDCVRAAEREIAERERAEAADAALGEARELLRQTDALYSERALLANPEVPDPLRVGRWIGNVRDFTDRTSKETSNG